MLYCCLFLAFQKSNSLNTAQLYSHFLKHPKVQTDTRKLDKGDLFFALKGPSFNGNLFAEKALEMGAAYAVVDEPKFAKNERFLLVENVLQALQDLALHHRRSFKIPFIAITGSNGKTTTKELIVAVLKQQFKTYATQGNLNNHIGVPLSILAIKKDAEMAVIEMGANHQKEIASYCLIAEPNYGLITNCGKAHIEGFGSEEGVRKGKGELFDYLKANAGGIFRNTELEYLEDMAVGIRQQITYGKADADYLGQPEMAGIFLNVKVQDEGKGSLIKTNLVGGYNFPNVMAAVAVGRTFGISMDAIANGIANYQPDNSRSQSVQRGSNAVILDAYNANPTSMKLAIESFASAPMENKIVWLGGMKEMGADSLKEHQLLVDLLEQFSWQNVLLVGQEFEAVRRKFSWFPNADTAAEFIRKNLPENSSILIKGSRGSKMETLLEALPSNI